MTGSIFTALLWFAAVGSGLVAGLFFAFSTFIMTALARIPPAHGITAMQSINTTIVRSLFMPLFFATTIASALLAALTIFDWGQPGALTTLAAGIIYTLGMFGCTVVFNVPLNNALAAVEPGSDRAATVWSGYLKDWVFWNHVRTVASTIACVLFIAAIAAR